MNITFVESRILMALKMNRQFGAVIEAERIAIGLIIIIDGRRKLP